MRKTSILPFLLALLLTLGSAGASAAATPAQAATPQGSAPAAAAAEAPAAPEQVDLGAPMPTHSELTIGKLDNGLTYYIRPYKKPEGRAELWLVVNAGSVLEDEDQRGLAHFLEHMAFNGTKRFAEQELVRYLESIGMQFGADINAWTGFDETVYTLRVPTDQPELLEKGFQILQEWAQNIAFDPAEIDKERGVIVEEWRLGRGSDARIRDRQFPILFKGSRYAERLPIGQREVIQKATREEMLRFYRDWYRPDLMAVIAVGDFDRARIEALVRQHFGGLTRPAGARPRTVYTVPAHEETLFAIATDPEATETRISVYHKQPKPSEATLGDYRRTLVETLYHEMLNARLEEPTHSDDPPFHWAASGSDDLVRTASVTLEAAEVPQGKTLRGLEALLTEIERVRRHGFTATEIERAKLDVQRSYEGALAEHDKLDSSTFAAEYMRNFLEGEPAPGIPFEHDLVKRLLPGITLAEINGLAGQWTSGKNRVIAISAPERAPVPGEKDLLAAYQRVEKQTIEPYVDRAVAGPLVPEPPKPGTVDQERSIAELGVTEWRLSNGARVVLKPTPFQNDQILLSGFSPGGLSLVPDESYLSGSLAAPFVRQSGVGRFDRLALEKALAGKAADATSYIGDDEEGVRGVASPRDAETLFQLTYLTLTSPRQDPGLFDLFLGGMQSYLERRQNEPEAVFRDRMAAALARGNPRGEPLTLERLSEIDLPTAHRIYRERFADAGDFTFVLVGNFTPAEIRPLVTTYLGGLPSRGGRERAKDKGVEPPQGVVRVEVDKGIEPRSRVEILFTGEAASFSRETVHDANALASALEIRLREVLREELGGVYGVGVSGGVDDGPRPRTLFTVRFACAPERVDELVKTVFAEVEAVRGRGLDETYLQRVREAERRQVELNLKNNAFWLAALEFYYSEGLDPRGILREGELSARVTAERVREMARVALHPDRYVLGVLNPAKAGEGEAEETGTGSGEPAAPAAVPPR